MNKPDETRISETFQELREGFDDVDLTLLTTFTLDVRFIEDNVVLPLTELSRIQTVADARDAEWSLDSCGFVLFHDAHTVGRTTACRLDIPTVPVAVRDGCFHPKIALVSGMRDGQREARLMVSSANLSRSGWGHNLEAGGTLDVASANIGKPLSRLLRALLRHAEAAGLEDRLYRTIVATTEWAAELPPQEVGPQLIVTIPGESPSLADHIREETTGPVRVIAPFIGHAGYIAQTTRALGERPLMLAPGLKVGDVTHLQLEHLRGLRNIPGLEFGRLKGAEPDRLQHLKCIAHDGGTIIGSHNFTEYATGSFAGGPPHNYEVSVDWPGVDIPLVTADPESFLGSTSTDEAAPGESSASDHVVSLTMHYPSRLELRWITEEPEPADLGSLSIRFGRGDGARSVELSSFGDGYARVDVETALLIAQTKVFELYRQGTVQPIFIGLVNERNRDARDRKLEVSLPDCLKVWIDRSTDGAIEPTERALFPNLADANDREAALLAAHFGDSRRLESYYQFFQAVRSMRDYVDSDKAGERALHVLNQRSGSLDRIVALLRSDSDAPETAWTSPLTRGILARELLRVAGLVAPHLPPEALDTLLAIRTELSPWVSAFDVMVAERDEDEEKLRRLSTLLGNWPEVAE